MTIDELTLEHSKECEKPVLQIGQSVFHTNYKKTLVTRMKDYTIMSNFNLTAFLSLIPKKIKPVLTSRWVHSLHIRCPQEESRTILDARVEGGQIIILNM